MVSRLRSFLDQWIISLQSYPVTHVIILAMTILWMVIIQQDYSSTNINLLIKLLLTGALMVPLTIIKSKQPRKSALPIIIGLAYYLLLPEAIENMYYAQGLQIIGSIVIAWLIPSLQIAREHNDSQDLTRSQFTHRWVSLAQGLIGGLILWGGITASLASIEFLFGLDITSKIYQHIGVITTLLMGSWIWLINLQQSSLSLLDLGAPGGHKGTVRKTEDLGTTYPRWMRIFGQYIFLPLCVIYGLILVSYGVKILATGVRPEGQLVYMVSGYVGFGLLTWFFLLPLERNNVWLHTAYRVLFISFILTSGLMIGALTLRLQQYGLTIDRFIVGAVIVWIISIAAGSLIWSKHKWIIGLSNLVIIAIVTIYSSPTIVKQYQLNQTQSLFTTATSNTGDASKLYGSLDYLARNYGTGRTAQVFSQDQVQALSGSTQRSFANDAMQELGITDYNTYNPYSDNKNQYRSRYNSNQQVTDIAGYNTMIQFDHYQGSRNDLTISGSLITIATGSINTSINLDDYSSDLRNLNNPSVSKQTTQSSYTITGDKLKLIITQANGQSNGTGVTIEGFAGYLLLK